MRCWHFLEIHLAFHKINNWYTFWASSLILGNESPIKKILKTTKRFKGEWLNNAGLSVGNNIQLLKRMKVSYSNWSLRNFQEVFSKKKNNTQDREKYKTYHFFFPKKMNNNNGNPVCGGKNGRMHSRCSHVSLGRGRADGLNALNLPSFIAGEHNKTMGQWLDSITFFKLSKCRPYTGICLKQATQNQS